MNQGVLTKNCPLWLMTTFEITLPMKIFQSLCVCMCVCVCVCVCARVRARACMSLFRALSVAHGGSQARGPVGAVAAGLRHSHSNARSEPLDPSPT